MHLTRKKLLICVQVFHCVSIQGLAQLHKRGFLRASIAESEAAFDSSDIETAYDVPQLEGYYSREPESDPEEIDWDQFTKFKYSRHLTPDTVIEISPDGKPISISGVEDVTGYSRNKMRMKRLRDFWNRRTKRIKWHDDHCPICLDAYRTEPADDIRVFPGCNHCFHSPCVEEWIDKLEKTPSLITCPTCRKLAPRKTREIATCGKVGLLLFALAALHLYLFVSGLLARS